MKLNASRSKHFQKDESGIAILLALMLGLVLSAGASALLINQLYAKRLSSSESYQQISEAAALNGFNRILALLNNQDKDQYRGFLFTIDNQGNTTSANNSWLNLKDNSELNLEEICTDIAVGLPQHPIPSRSWPKDEIPFHTNDSKIFREDSQGKIQAFYRLRGYSSPSKTGVGEGVFEVEGVVKRINNSSDDYVLARTLLTRSLYVNGSVSNEDDWGVLTAQHLVLGPAQIDGPGRILHLVQNNEAYLGANGCSGDTLLTEARGQADNDNLLGSRIWPVLNRTLPPSNLYAISPEIDEHIWSFDDTRNKCGDSGIRSKICIRSKTDTNRKAPMDVIQQGNSVRIPTTAICPGHSGDCHVYVEHIHLQKNSRLLIENDSRPVVLHMELPQGSLPSPSGMSGGIQLGKNAQICGVNTGSDRCNNRPERFVITASSGDSPQNCQASQQQLKIQGMSLPSAMVSLPRGSVHLTGDTQLRGMIWAHAFCTNGHQLTLTTTEIGSNQHLSVKAGELWEWKNSGFTGIGRTINRGILGTGIDTFRQW
ncbi:hypothetical protein [Synechococcus sp. WH 8020]|uniref:hypothetical protein n=1 Tax=Synechococcus sp. (strain WH8020) TaxID=32052 RepID=UPI000A8A5608|nr:hypothetical protein [Synechococcus sp. WH 8020]